MLLFLVGRQHPTLLENIWYEEVHVVDVLTYISTKLLTDVGRLLAVANHGLKKFKVARLEVGDTGYLQDTPWMM